MGKMGEEAQHFRPFFSENFHTTLAVWKLHLCLKGSKHCCRQTSGAFTWHRGSLPKSSLFVQQSKSALFLGSHQWGSCQRNFKGERKEYLCCLMQKARETLRELPGVGCVTRSRLDTLQIHLQASTTRETTWPILNM